MHITDTSSSSPHTRPDDHNSAGALVTTSQAPAARPDVPEPAKVEEPSISQALDHAWKNRGQAKAEAVRLMIEGPAAFGKADMSSKLAVLALLVVLMAFIANTFIAPGQDDQKAAIEKVGAAFSGIGADLGKAAETIEQSKLDEATQSAGETIQKLAVPAQQPSPTAPVTEPASQKDKKTDAPDRP